MTGPRKRWLDQEAGPVVRPYALTRGRTRPRGEAFDLIDVVSATGPPPTDRPWLGPEHWRILQACRRPVVVADVASDIDLPLAVVRVLLGDLHQEGLVTVLRPASDAPISDLSVMRNVLDGLKAL
jgi:Protein of unknown function (DUF742)